MVDDRLRLGGDPVHLARHHGCRCSRSWPSRDHIVPAGRAAPLPDLVGSEDNHELCLDAGHMGLVVGRTAAKVDDPAIIDFLRRRRLRSTAVARREPTPVVELGPSSSRRCGASSTPCPRAT